MFSQLIVQKCFKAFEKILYGKLDITLADGRVYSFEGRYAGPSADMTIHDHRVFRALAFEGDIGLAAAYRDGWFDTTDLEALMMLGVKNADNFESLIYGKFFSQLASRMSYLFRRNTVSGSRRNIHDHYDLGNDFYQLWLDDSMTYSAAIFGDKSESLKHAQERKYDRILSRLDNPRGNVLEVGCGWGGFADQASGSHDVDLKAITISSAQYQWAKNRLNGRSNVSVVKEDYRHQEGKYDNIVSIEMFEAVGKHFWPLYFKKMKSLLNKNGKAVIQTISIHDRYYDRYIRTGDMVRSFIFPGGMLPSYSALNRQITASGLKMTDCLPLVRTMRVLYNYG